MNIQKDITIRGYKICYRKTGHLQADTTYVLIHGIGVSMDYFMPLANTLGKNAIVYVPDLPGFGSSPKPKEALGIEEYADIIEDLMRIEKITQPVLVGHSMGCQVVVELLRRHPELSKLGILIGPVVHQHERNIWRQLFRLVQDIGREPYGTRLVVGRDYIRCGVPWYMQVLPHMMEYPTEERIADVRTPLLLIRGNKDSVAPHSWVKELSARAPDATISEIDGAHNVMHRNSEEVARLCQEKLEHA